MFGLLAGSREGRSRRRRLLLLGLLLLSLAGCGSAVALLRGGGEGDAAAPITTSVRGGTGDTTTAPTPDKKANDPSGGQGATTTTTTSTRQHAKTSGGGGASVGAMQPPDQTNGGGGGSSLGDSKVIEAAGGVLSLAGAPAPPPAPKITAKPTNPDNSASGSFGFKDDKPVNAFMCAIDGAAATVCGSGSSGSYDYSGLADGEHTFAVYAAGAGRTSGTTSYRWRIDTVAPPTPVFKKTEIKGDRAHFEYRDTEKGVDFQCRLDAGGWLKCGDKKDYDHLSSGPHTFCVKALDKASNESAPACYGWNGGGVQPYTIGMKPLSGLYPGASAQPIDLTFDNQNTDTVLVTTLTVQITSITGGSNLPNACTAADYEVTNYAGGAFEIPVGQSSLSSLGITQSAWPTIRMKNTAANQDGCRNATVNLTFEGKP